MCPMSPEIGCLFKDFNDKQAFEMFFLFFVIKIFPPSSGFIQGSLSKIQGLFKDF